jgi:hypothetical protein
MEHEMKNSIIIGCVIFCVLVLFWSSSVSAHGGHRYYSNHHYGHDHFRPHRYRGLYFGLPLINYSYIHTSPTRVIREIEEPIVYIEKPVEPIKKMDTIESEPSNYWYYCKKPGAYYPEVERCPDGWMQVVPQKPPK